MIRTIFTPSLLVACVLLAGCAATNSRPAIISPEKTTNNLPNQKTTVELSCPSNRKDVPNAFYIGTYQGVENDIAFGNIAQDIFCADLFAKSINNSKGFVAIYGSSRIPDRKSECATDDIKCSQIKENNIEIYNNVFDFSYLWTKKHGSQFPIMTGAGPGLMEAGSRGAMKAVLEDKAAGRDSTKRSIGYTTYYDKPQTSAGLSGEFCGAPPTQKKSLNSLRKYYCGNPANAFWKYPNKIKETDGEKITYEDIITDGLIFSSVSIREFMMIKHSSAIIIAPGGSGTEWEIFQILETIKSKQLADVPVYLIGNKIAHWKSFSNRVEDMIARGTIKKNDLKYEHIENAVDLTPKLEALLDQAHLQSSNN